MITQHPYVARINPEFCSRTDGPQPFDPHVGPVWDVLVSLPHDTQTDVVSDGVFVKALVDTGFSGSLMLASDILQQLGAISVRKRKTWGIGATPQVLREYQLTVAVPFTSGDGRCVVCDPCFVSETEIRFGRETHRPYQAVLGLELLTQGWFALKGFTPSFEFLEGPR